MNAYARPTTLDEAIALLAAGRRTILSGGTDLYPGAGPRLAGDVLDVTAIPDLAGMKTVGGLRLGSCVTWAQIAGADLPPACRALQQAARQVGGRQIQNQGTLGGNLCNASPAADGIPPLLVLDAVIHMAGPGGTRSMMLDDFLQGPRQTARAVDELVTAITVPAASLAGRSAFVKLGARAYLVISIAMVAARMHVSDGRIVAAAIAVGACSGRARRLAQVESALMGQPAQGAMAAIRDTDVQRDLSPITDVRATEAYRRIAAAELVRSAVAGALA